MSIKDETRYQYNLTLRRDTKRNWRLTNPVLLSGEMGIEYEDITVSDGEETAEFPTASNNQKMVSFKVGNGVDRWNDLPYASGEQGVAGEQGDPLRVDELDTIDRRYLFDDRNKGFSFLAIDEGKIYFKLTNGIGDWTEGFPFGQGIKGEKGEKGEKGTSIESVEFTSTTHESGLPHQLGAIDTYTVILDNGITEDFKIQNGTAAPTLIGQIVSIMATDTYVPDGTVRTDGAEYTRAQFPSFYDYYLSEGKLLTCTYTEWSTQVGLTGNCAKFALDTDNQKFKVPLLKDGDSITNASSVAELGKSYKAGLPNVVGTIHAYQNGTNQSGCLFITDATSASIVGSSQSNLDGTINIDASRNSEVYRNDVTTVLDEQVRLRHFVVVASAQNNQSVFDWSAYMSSLAGKANNDLSNVTAAADEVIRSKMTLSTLGTRTTTGDWTITGCSIGLPLFIMASKTALDGFAVIRVTSGAEDGTDGVFAVGNDPGKWTSSNVFVCVPSAKNVTLSIPTIGTTVILRAKQ